MGQSTPELATRLSSMSIDRAWNPWTSIDWPASLDRDADYFMSPELISIYGTECYDQLTEIQRKRLSFYENGNFFSFVLLGERPVVSGMADRMYSKDTAGAVSNYLHHFIDEENKHMVMFSNFCNRYLGKVYPEKKVIFNRDYSEGEEDLVFYCRVLIVEELGDFYNVKMLDDARINPLVRQINDLHHRDEARHIAFGRTRAAEMFDRHASKWDEPALASFRKWLAEYFASSWTDFYNPSVYKDAGLENPYQVRQMALKSPVCREFRQRASARLVKFFLKHGFLSKEPVL